MSPALDLDFVRAQFPAFEQPSLDGQLFFENAGGSYTCRQVVDRLTRFYTQRKVQPYGPYEASRLGGEEMDEAQVRLAAAMGVAADEVSFGPSTTQNTYVLSKAFGEMLSAGDAIIVTNQDHEANTGPWRRLDKLGIDVREWKLNPETGMLDVRDLENMMDAHVKLVCFPHCSNIVGAPNEVAAIVKRSGRRVPIPVLTVSATPRTAFRTLARLARIFTCFQPIKRSARTRGLWSFVMNSPMRSHRRRTTSTQGIEPKNSPPPVPTTPKSRPAPEWWITLKHCTRITLAVLLKRRSRQRPKRFMTCLAPMRLRLCSPYWTISPTEILCD